MIANDARLEVNQDHKQTQKLSRDVLHHHTEVVHYSIEDETPFVLTVEAKEVRAASNR